jgi:hypothetical protein
MFSYKIFWTIFKNCSKKRPNKCLILGFFLGPFKKGQRLVIRWFWSNLKESLKVRAKAPCGYRELLV